MSLKSFLTDLKQGITGASPDHNSPVERRQEQAQNGERFTTRNTPTPTVTSTDTQFAQTVAYIINNSDTNPTPARLGLVLYYAEHAYNTEHGEHLTNAEYIPYEHGMFPPALHTILAKLSTETNTIEYRGEKSDKYITTESLTDPQHTDFLDTIIAETDPIDIQELITFAKNTTPYKRTDYHAPIDTIPSNVRP